MMWILLLLPLLASPIRAKDGNPPETYEYESNHFLSALFWTLLAIGVLPLLYVYRPNATNQWIISKFRQRLIERRLSPLTALWSHVSLPADLTEASSLTSYQTEQVFSLMKNLVAIPVLKIREVLLTGTFTEVKNSKEKESKEKTPGKGSARGAAKRPEEVNAKARSPLAMEIIQHTIQPVYDNPHAFAEPEKYEKTRKGTKCQLLQAPWTAGFSGHAIFEISDRFPAHQNDNKFRVAFDVWNSSQREHFVIFGVGPELPAYCKRVFKLKELCAPEFHATDPLVRQLEEAGIQTWYYSGTYRSHKFKADKRKSFLLAFHNIPIEDDHPFARLPEMRRLPFARMMFLAHQLDAPVFCADPEVHFLLSLLHTSFFYIFHSPSKHPKVLLDAIDIAMDRMEVVTLWPPDAVHLFGLQMIDFCGKFIEEKSPEPESQPFLSYHFLPKKKPAAPPSIGSSKRKEGGLDNPPPAKQCLDAYEKSILEVGKVVETAKLGKTQIDWRHHLPEEMQFLGYAYVEPAYFGNVAFEHYYFELQPTLEELRYRREERETEYDERRSSLETAK